MSQDDDCIWDDVPSERERLENQRQLELASGAVGKMTDHSMLQAEAVEPTSAFRLELSELLRLSRHAEFQMALMGIASVFSGSRRAKPTR